jgi:hypothetical protein
MPPRKRKPALAPITEQEPAEAVHAGEDAAAPPQQQQQDGNHELAAIVHEKIREIDRAGRSPLPGISLAIVETATDRQHRATRAPGACAGGTVD